jgi:hypothetical protein
MIEGEFPEPDPVTSWVLVSKNLMCAYGVFNSEREAMEFGTAQNLPLDAMDTVPLVTTEMMNTKLDVEALRRQLEKKQ